MTQQVINQQTFFITIKYDATISNPEIYKSEIKIKRIIESVNKVTDFYLMSICNNRPKIKTSYGFCKPNTGLIIQFDWMGPITEVDGAVVKMHEIMKNIKAEFSVIKKIDVFVAGNDHEYTDLQGNDLVEDDIN